ncbi:MAG: hypothetical protein J2P17_05770 [Mycobacterium sp.]|nr:hypothetical protein [Mycobacterium sp.]
MISSEEYELGASLRRWAALGFIGPVVPGRGHQSRVSAVGAQRLTRPAIDSSNSANWDSAVVSPSSVNGQLF